MCRVNNKGVIVAKIILLGALIISRKILRDFSKILFSFLGGTVFLMGRGHFVAPALIGLP